MNSCLPIPGGESSPDVYQVDYGVIPGDLTLIEGKLPDNVDLIDPWENPYLYETNNIRSYTLYSRGPDSAFDGDDIYADE